MSAKSVDINRHLGYLVYLAEPLHGVEGIAQEVRVKLGLQHAYLRLIELTLVLNELLLVAA